MEMGLWNIPERPGGRMFSEGPSFFLNRGMLHACLMTICGRYTLTDRINISHFIYRNFFLKTQFLGLAADGGLLLGRLWRAHPDVTPLITVHFSFVC